MTELTRRGVVATGLAVLSTAAFAQDAAATVSYGVDDRQRIDLYGPFGEERPAPILMWLPGGG